MASSIVGRGLVARHPRSFGHIIRPIGARGIRYRSKAEANYSLYLDWLQKIGRVLEWQYEPVELWFTPWPPPVSKRKRKYATAWSDPRAIGLGGITRGRTFYRPDFAVREAIRPPPQSGPLVRSYYVEVKGYMDRDSETAIERARRYFPGIEIQIVTSREIAALRRQVGGVVPGWIT